MISRRRLLLNLPAILVAAAVPQPSNDYYPLPNPQFQIGQKMKAYYDLESSPGELVEYIGTVKGLCWKPEGWRIEVGWVYQVFFPPSPTESESWWENIPEFYLESC